MWQAQAALLTGREKYDNLKKNGMMNTILVLPKPPPPGHILRRASKARRPMKAFQCSQMSFLTSTGLYFSCETRQSHKNLNTSAMWRTVKHLVCIECRSAESVYFSLWIGAIVCQTRFPLLEMMEQHTLRNPWRQTHTHTMADVAQYRRRGSRMTYLIFLGLVRGGHMSQILDDLLGVLGLTGTRLSSESQRESKQSDWNTRHK